MPQQVVTGKEEKSRWWRPLRYLWSGWGMFWMVLLTIPVSLAVLVSGALGVSHHKLQWAPRAWGRLLMWGIHCRVRLIGGDKLQPGEAYVFAGNHASALDIPSLQSVMPKNFRWVAKKELFSIPLFGPALTAAGNIPVDRSASRQAMQSLILASRRVSDGASVVIFPEGTRSDDGNLLPFKSGGFLLAIKSGKPVVPFYLHGTRQAMANDRFLLDPGPIEVILGDPIPTDGRKAGEREDLSDLVRERILGLQRQAGEGPPVDSPGTAA
ncbi:MAG: 1-acyl-sn-glycerol-3-phosphate acyltransferase [Proteobacteria bacterium]|nr:1-acyl-sn-glycerol-3-phosphate acyltransferase [Pseudomonadota bacterium]MBU4383983.1 1-acyl-sn-glycerol-3-phosphate acyltransferase [Pseudomonadota bacterium]MBU4604291.1 1-acyl-sn-glycerol-3-phosphate acyltransferase [Pseudomonadota bacterium]MCG2763623.1 1-acyl-sn-glycerol-3-phosphate acyltransferase [Desulfarculaceae bacterium]